MGLECSKQWVKAGGFYGSNSDYLRNFVIVL